jgi:hypothetical protein
MSDIGHAEQERTAGSQRARGRGDGHDSAGHTAVLAAHHAGYRERAGGMHTRRGESLPKRSYTKGKGKDHEDQHTYLDTPRSTDTYAS